MTKFLGSSKSTPFFFLFGFAITIGLASCDSTPNIGPASGVGNGRQSISASAANPAKPGDATLVQIAIDSGFNEFVAALTYVDDSLDVGLVDVFSANMKQHTIFAPSDSAFFVFYDSAGVNSITDLDAETVLDVLLYHVTKGRRTAASVVPQSKIKQIQTLLNKKFEVDTEANIEAIGSIATIIQPDISASNGIIHVVDGVLVPFD